MRPALVALGSVGEWWARQVSTPKTLNVQYSIFHADAPLLTLGHSTSCPGARWWIHIYIYIYMYIYIYIHIYINIERERWGSMYIYIYIYIYIGRRGEREGGGNRKDQQILRQERRPQTDIDGVGFASPAARAGGVARGDTITSISCGFLYSGVCASLRGAPRGDCPQGRNHFLPLARP